MSDSDLKNLLKDEPSADDEVQEEYDNDNDQVMAEGNDGDFPVEVDEEEIIKYSEVDGEVVKDLDSKKKPVKGLANFLKSEIYPVIESCHPEQAKAYKDLVHIVFEALTRRKMDVSGLFEIDKELLAESIVPLVYNDLRHHFETNADPKANARAAMAEMLTLQSGNGEEVKNVVYLDNEPTAYIVVGGDEEYLILEMNNRIVGGLSFLTTEGKDKSIIPTQFKIPSTTVIVKWDKFNQVSIVPALFLTEKGRHPEYAGGDEASSVVVTKPDPKLIPIEELDGETAVKLMRLTAENLDAASEFCKRNNIDIQSVIMALAMSTEQRGIASVPTPQVKKTQISRGSMSKLSRFLKKT